MNDMELAEEIKWRAQKLREYAASTEYPSAPFCIDTAYYMEKILAALRRESEQWREVEPGHIFYAWLFEDGSFDWSLHAVEKYAREAADEEERTDPPGKIKVIPVRVVHAKPERPPSGEMVMVPREPTFKMVSAGAISNSYLTPRELAVRIYRAMLSAAEAEGRKG